MPLSSNCVSDSAAPTRTCRVLPDRKFATKLKTLPVIPIFFIFINSPFFYTISKADWKSIKTPTVKPLVWLCLFIASCNLMIWSTVHRPCLKPGWTLLRRLFFSTWYVRRVVTSLSSILHRVEVRLIGLNNKMILVFLLHVKYTLSCVTSQAKQRSINIRSVQ